MREFGKVFKGNEKIKLPRVSVSHLLVCPPYWTESELISGVVG